jgi:Flp pilus assembly protein TadD
LALRNALRFAGLRPACGRWLAAQAVLAGLLITALPAVATTPVTAADIERQYRGGEPRVALQRLEQALAQRPGEAPLRFLQAVLAAETGQTAQATRLLERMTEEFPDLPEPYNNLAVLQAAGGQIDRARSLLETALRLDPGYRTAHENLGDVFVRLAQRAYEAAASPRSEPALQTKLRLARELAALR